MIRLLLLILLALPPLLLPPRAEAEMVATNRTIRPKTILRAGDLVMVPGEVPGTLIAFDEAVGLEARKVLYAGRPIRFEDVGPAAIIERNQIVRLIFRKGGLTIAAEGRSLGRGGIGDSLRIMNLSSRTTVSGIVAPNGAVYVGSALAAFQ